MRANKVKKRGRLASLFSCQVTELEFERGGRGELEGIEGEGTKRLVVTKGGLGFFLVEGM